MSLDGRKEIHDRYRVDYAGKGSWEKIVPKFQKLVEARGGKDYYMRGTFTHANPDFLKDVQTMLDLGFRELSMEPVVSAVSYTHLIVNAVLLQQVLMIMMKMMKCVTFLKKFFLKRIYQLNVLI